MIVKSTELYIESFMHKKGDPIPDLSSNFEEVKGIFGNQLDDKHNCLLDIESQIKSATKDEMTVYYLTVKEKRKVYNIPYNIYDERIYAK